MQTRSDTANQHIAGLHILRTIIFISGMLALAYETIWFRWLAQQIGSSLLSSTLITGAFLLANAAGAIFGGYGLAVKYRKPLLLYGMLEAAVAAASLLLLPVFGQILHLVKGWSILSISLMMAASFLVPSFFMGITFPVFIRAAAHAPCPARNPAGFVYLWNVLGASAGVLLGGIYLVPHHGIWYGLGITAILGLANAGAAAWNGRHEIVNVPSENAPSNTKKQPRILLAWRELSPILFW